jgi:hypothetical protein
VQSQRIWRYHEANASGALSTNDPIYNKLKKPRGVMFIGLLFIAIVAAGIYI